MIPLYDAHNHLHDERLAARLDEIASELPRLGLKRCVVNGTRESDWLSVEALAKRFSWVIPAFGLHPWFIKERSTKWLDTLQSLLDRNPNATIGEIGLDRWMREPDVADQEKVFIAHLKIATDRNLACSIHCLKAWGQLESVLKAQLGPARGFLLHSYGGSAEMVPIFTKLGGYFSISGYFAHDRKATQREVFKTVPIDRLLVESDAPDMAPPFGMTPEGVNDPCNIAPIYDFAARLFGFAPPDFASRIERNFNRLFS